MDKIRLEFLDSILRSLDDNLQLYIANEYNTEKGNPIIYENDEDGLETLCGGMSIDDILRASHYGNYVYTEPYVFINTYGNLESSEYIDVDWEEVAKWMIESGYKGANDAWTILNASSYAECCNFQYDFVDEFEYRVDGVDWDKLNRWFDETSPSISYVVLTSWNDLKDEYDMWVEQDEMRFEKTLERCRGENY